jgi:hypothetical protein
VNYQTDNVVLGILTAFAGMVATMLGTIGVAMRLDRAWKLLRRAGGHEQKSGMLERIFVISAFVGASAFGFWFLIIQGPGPSIAPTSVISLLG